MSSVSSQLPQRTCIRGAYLHSAHVQPASQRGDFGPKVSATQLAGMHLVGSRASGTLSRQPDGSHGESQEPPLGNKAAVPLQTDGELHWPLSLKLACGCHAKTQGCPPRAMLRPVCHPVVPGGDYHVAPTRDGRAGCQGSSPGFYTRVTGSPAPLPTCGG